MAEFQAMQLQGALLESLAGDIQLEDFVRTGSSIVVEGVIQGTRWEKITLSSNNPLHREDTRVMEAPFRYPIVCRRSGPRILVMSIARDIVDHFASMYRGVGRVLPLKRVSITIDALVKELVSRPTEYSLGFVHARVPAFGASLRSVSFYGDDLADASIFRDNVSLMVFFICGLKSAIAGQEVVRLGSDGTVSFNMGSPRRLLEVEKVLTFLRQYGYLESDLLKPD